MSKNLSKYQRWVDPAGYGINSVIMGSQEKKPETVYVNAPTSPTPPATQSVALRDQMLGTQQRAAGLAEDDNSADMLGNTQPKRRSASRAVLG